MTKALLLVAIVPAVMIYAADVPSMKEGLWLIHSQVIQHPSEEKTTDASTKLCRNAAYDKRIREATMPKGACAATVDKSNGTTKEYETNCKVAGSRIKFTETVETTGDSISHTVTKSVITPPLGGLTGMTIVADMTYISACPAAMQVGDVILPSGEIAHLPIP